MSFAEPTGPEPAPSQAAYFNVTAEDEALHEPGPDPQWNESAFFHVVEEDGKRGALFRLGRRVNEGRAEVTALQLRADGSALVGFERAAISGNTRWAAGGLDFRSDADKNAWTVGFDGELSHLADGLEFLEPGRALRDAPKVKAEFRLTATDVAPPYRTTTDGTYHGGASIAADHYAGVSRVAGSMTIDGQDHAVRGFGFRDHSWGVRNWQAVDCWRWYYGQLDADTLFSVVVMKASDTEATAAGILIRAGRPHIVTDLETRVRYSGEPHFFLDSAEITIPHPDGEVIASFEPTSRLPLRHRRGEEVLRIVEQLAVVYIDGRPAAGWFETADRIVEGRPFGLAHEL